MLVPCPSAAEAAYPEAMSRTTPTIAPVLDAAPEGAVLLDVRWSLDGSKGRATYLAGHLPGAVYVDLGTELAAPADPARGRHPLPDPEDFAASMRRAGVDDDSLVVAYDDTDGSQASRLVWMLRALGVEAALLNGGLRGVIGMELSVVDERPEPGSFSARAWGVEVTATPDEVASGHYLVIDARAPERYRGESEPIDPRAGHVPGALNVPFSGNVDADGRFLGAEDLLARFTDAGIDPEDEVIVYCGSGVTATHDLLALERAGLVGARLLPGSWSQWSADPTREVATGATP